MRNEKKIFKTCEDIYKKYNKPEFIHPDPLEHVLLYNNIRDREIAAFIAASLALGRVELILKAVENVLKPLSPTPSKALISLSLKDLEEIYKDFKYRFFTGKHISRFLWGLRCIIESYGSIEACTAKTLSPSWDTVLPGLEFLVDSIKSFAPQDTGILLPSPSKKSACKRLNLFLRWMVRKDRVDPGGWTSLSPSLLIVPLDTHMFRISTNMGFTGRKTPDLKTALEITEAFKRISPDDPVKYDFALTRSGINPEIAAKKIL